MWEVIGTIAVALAALLTYWLEHKRRARGKQDEIDQEIREADAAAGDASEQGRVADGRYAADLARLRRLRKHRQ